MTEVNNLIGICLGHPETLNTILYDIHFTHKTLPLCNKQTCCALQFTLMPVSAASIFAERASTRLSLERPVADEVSGRGSGPLLTMVPREETAVRDTMESLDSMAVIAVGEREAKVYT